MFKKNKNEKRRSFVCDPGVMSVLHGANKIG